jgi:GT2 family glycosyltransferase
MSERQDEAPGPEKPGIDFTRSFHPDAAKAKAIEEVFSNQDAPRSEREKKPFSSELSVIIPTHDGIQNLKDSLPALLRGLKGYKESSVEIIVLDNASSDGTAAFIKKSWPGIKVMRYNKPMGNCRIINEGVSSARFKTVFIMEDDVKVDPDFAQPLQESLGDEEVIAAVPAIHLESKHNLITSINLMYFIDGALFLRVIADGKFPEPVYLPGLLNTATAFKKEAFKDLGGFDSLFDPGYMEDLDMGYRAWKRGYKVVYNRASRVYHTEKDSFRDHFQGKEWEWLRIRNYLLFMEKNITSRDYHSKHWWKVRKKVLMIQLGLDGDRDYLKAWQMAEKSGKEVARRRKMEKKEAQYTDQELIFLFASHPDNRLGLG